METRPSVVSVLVVYYSRYGHLLRLARAAREGAASVDQVDAVLRRAGEFPEVEAEIQQDGHARAAWEEQQDIPVRTFEDLRHADGVLCGARRRGSATWPPG